MCESRLEEELSLPTLRRGLVVNSSGSQKRPRYIVETIPKAQYRERISTDEHYIHYLFRRCGELTSIRGVRRFVICERRIVRCFWGCFISICWLLVAYIVFKNLVSYFEYQTVMRQHKKLLLAGDFPVVTICTNAFLGNTPDSRRLMGHIEQYKQWTEKKFREAFERKNYTQLHSYLTLQSTPFYNVNNFEVFSNITASFVSASQKQSIWDPKHTNNVLLKNGTCLQCASKASEKMALCPSEPFIDFKYRNCVSFKIPENNTNNFINSVRIVVGLHYRNETDYFPHDSVVSDLLALNDYIHIFIHERDGLPTSHPQYSIPYGRNRLGTLSFTPTKVIRLDTPTNRCINDSESYLDHANRSVRIQPHLAINAERRARVREKCNCEAWWQPLDRWPLKAEDMCGNIEHRGITQALRDIECMSPLSQAFSGELESELRHSLNYTEPCSQVSYTSSLDMLDYSLSAQQEVVGQISVFYVTKKLCDACKNISSPECQARVADLKKALRDRNQTLLNSQSRESVGESSGLWRFAYPRIDENQSEFTDHRTQGLIIDLVPGSLHVSEDVESLVRPFWSLIGQLGGASSFIAGITFTLVGEVIELVYRLIEARLKRGVGIVERGWMEIRGDLRLVQTPWVEAAPTCNDEEDEGGG